MTGAGGRTIGAALLDPLDPPDSARSRAPCRERLRPAVTVLLALAPILVTLALLITRLPAWAAPAAGCVTAAVLGVAVFGTDPARLGAALVGGAPTLLEVAAIIAGGITLSRIMERSGANGRLGEWLSAGAGPTLATALLMVHGVVPFLEAVTGFGVSLIIGVPLLVGLGFTPFRAAVLSLCGLAIAPWGSMAPGTLLGARLTGLDFQQIGVAAALWNVVPTVAGAVVAAVLVLRGRGRRGPTVLRGTAVAVGSAVLQSGLILFGATSALAALVAPEFPLEGAPLLEPALQSRSF